MHLLSSDFCGIQRRIGFKFIAFGTRLAQLFLDLIRRFHVGFRDVEYVIDREESVKYTVRQERILWPRSLKI